MIFLTIIFHQMLQLTVSRPNILLIVADDLGFADVSWNNPKMKTPILQSLASEGIILDQFYAQPKCSPSRSALLTGIYPYKMSMQRGSIGDFRPTGLPTHLPTLPELLRSSGYSTHLIGKWHIGYCHHSYTPNYRGFDTFFGSLAQQSDHYSREHEINKYMGSGYDLWRNKNVSHDGKGMYSTHLWKQETVSLINSFNKSTPWFIELATTAPHTPYQVPDKYTRSYRRNMGRNSEEDEIVRKGMVTALDESIGEIISALKQAGNYEDTLIVFCSDNGAGSKEGNAPLRGKKGEIFEGGVRVPAMIHGAPLKRSSILSSGYKSSNLVHIVDLFTTLLKFAGVEHDQVDGVDLFPLLTRDIQVRDNIVHNIDIDDQSETFQLAARRGNWKIIWGQTKEFKEHKKGDRKILLFNIKNDPRESTNLAETQSDVLARMKTFVINLAKDMKTAYHPNGLNLAFPRYHNGLLEPGWCRTGWWEKIWKYKANTKFLEKIK